MNSVELLHGLFAGAIGLLTLASLHDVAARTIPNLICLLLACVGVILRLTDGTLLLGLAAAAIMFAVAAFCCVRGWMGGGDAKLLAAVALVLPPSRVGDGVVAIALAGSVLALIYIALHRAVPPPGPRPAGLLARIVRAELFRLRRRGPLPYGVAIAAGTIFTLFGGGA